MPSFFKTAVSDQFVNLLNPKAIVVYGAVPDAIFGKYKDAGIRILQFDRHKKCLRLLFSHCKLSKVGFACYMSADADAIYRICRYDMSA